MFPRQWWYTRPGQTPPALRLPEAGGHPLAARPWRGQFDLRFHLCSTDETPRPVPPSDTRRRCFGTGSKPRAGPDELGQLAEGRWQPIPNRPAGPHFEQPAAGLEGQHPDRADLGTDNRSPFPTPTLPESFAGPGGGHPGRVARRVRRDRVGTYRELGPVWSGATGRRAAVPGGRAGNAPSASTCLDLLFCGPWRWWLACSPVQAGPAGAFRCRGAVLAPSRDLQDNPGPTSRRCWCSRTILGVGRHGAEVARAGADGVPGRRVTDAAEGPAPDWIRKKPGLT